MIKKNSNNIFMKFSNVRLLVQDYKKCFKFYTEQLGFEPLWGDIDGCYASFKVAEGIEGLAIFVSDFMAPTVGNVEKTQPVGFREKSLISFEVENVDETYKALSEKGIAFINKPIDMPDWGMRVVHLRDPEENLIEFYTPLAAQ
jgi:catechol 2,3-dioxygenase-like lactoylglutathione lyase family enzyme